MFPKSLPKKRRNRVFGSKRISDCPTCKKQGIRLFNELIEDCLENNIEEIPKKDLCRSKGRTGELKILGNPFRGEKRFIAFRGNHKNHAFYFHEVKEIDYPPRTLLKSQYRIAMGTTVEEAIYLVQGNIESTKCNMRPKRR